jgi:hypothetical protein
MGLLGSFLIEIADPAVLLKLYLLLISMVRADDAKLGESVPALTYLQTNRQTGDSRYFNANEVLQC